MTTPAIRVENFGKKYLISHQQRERYTALRDVLTNKAKGLGLRIVNLGRTPVPRSSSKGEFWALQDVSFKVQPGERIGIIGRIPTDLQCPASVCAHAMLKNDLRCP